MPVIVEDVLKQSGMTPEDIKALDQKILAGLTTVVTSANEALDRAELAKRGQEQMYQNDIVPALNKWGNEKAQLESQVAFYKRQNEMAKEGGFIPSDAPTFAASADGGTRDANGRFVPGKNDVPGSPSFEEFEQRAGGAIGVLTDLQWKYQTLFGSAMPDAPTTLIREAESQKLPLMDYAARKYSFAAKEQEIAAARQKEHDDKIRKEASDAKDREYAEKYGNNPHTRVAEPSKFSQVSKAVASGERKDPLKMSREERRANTAQAIHKEISELAASA